MCIYTYMHICMYTNFCTYKEKQEKNISLQDSDSQQAQSPEGLQIAVCTEDEVDEGEEEKEESEGMKMSHEEKGWQGEPEFRFIKNSLLFERQTA